MSDQAVRAANARLRMLEKLRKKQAEEMQRLHQGDEQKQKDALMGFIYKEFCTFQKMQDDKTLMQEHICPKCGCVVTRSVPDFSKRWNMGQTSMLMPQDLDTICSDCIALYGTLQYLKNRPNPKEPIVIDEQFQ